MKNLLIMIVLICAWASTHAQINYVKNPSFEEYTNCPNDINQIVLAKYWTCAVDTVGEPYYAPEWFHKCGVPSLDVGVPNNLLGYQYPHFGDAMAGAMLYYDKTPPPPVGVSTNWRDYIQGHMLKPLQNGITYCVSFWLNVAESSGYAHDNIGVYLDNGNINKRLPAGIEITDVVPQVYSHSIIKDTMNWTKVEGTFVATGNETHITIGNFAKNIDVDTAFLYWGVGYQFSYYYIDDISIIPINLPANAGVDTWVEQGKKVQIGRVGDTTVMGLDCKWYKKGALIDSGAIITVNANTIKHAIDTYVVVQTICGIVKRDTVTVRTVGLGLSEMEIDNKFSIHPNPSNGNIIITSTHVIIPTKEGTLNATIYDLLGRVVQQQNLSFNNKEATIKLNLPSATYILELKDEAGNVQWQRIVIE